MHWTLIATGVGWIAILAAWVGLLWMRRAAPTCCICGGARSRRDRFWRLDERCRPCDIQRRVAARAGLDAVYRAALGHAWRQNLRGGALHRAVGSQLFYASLAPRPKRGR